MNYPARGQMSDDGKVYTHTDGTVHEVVINRYCKGCSLENKPHADCQLIHHKANADNTKAFKLIEGAYVPYAEEQAACDMARAQVVKCAYWHAHAMVGTSCVCCPDFEEKTCPARAYLSAHGATDAWEVKP